MSVRARIDVDVVYHDYTATSLTVGAASEHLAVSPPAAVTVTGTVGTSAITITGLTSCSTFCVKNTGGTVLRLGGSIDVPAGRLAVIPTTAVPSVASVGGNGAYTVLWVG